MMSHKNIIIKSDTKVFLTVCNKFFHNICTHLYKRNHVFICTLPIMLLYVVSISRQIVLCMCARKTTTNEVDEKHAKLKRVVASCLTTTRCCSPTWIFPRYNTNLLFSTCLPCGSNIHDFRYQLHHYFIFIQFWTI